jgi:hypothetical protein
MYNPSLNWVEQVKHIVNEHTNQKQFVLEGTVTSINNSAPYAVKVMLEPYQIETGWLKIATPYIGNNLGLIFPPPQEGTMVKVIFDMGDLNTGTVIGGVYSPVTLQPNVPFGAVGFVHSTGSSILINSDGSISINSSKGVTINGKTSQSW